MNHISVKWSEIVRSFILQWKLTVFYCGFNYGWTKTPVRFRKQTIIHASHLVLLKLQQECLKPRFWMFSPLHSGVTGVFDPLLFASTLIFISGKERSLAIMRKHSFCLWQLRLNVVLGRIYFYWTLCPLVFSSMRRNTCCFSSVDKIMAALQPPAPLHHSHFILLTQDKAQTNVTQLSGSLSLGAFIYLSGCSGLLSCRLTLTDSWNLAEDAASAVWLPKC